MDIELLNKYKVFERIKNYWVKNNKLNKVNINFDVKEILLN